MLPRTIMHVAASLDGRLDHFTADIGLYYELAGEWIEDATLAGCDTLLAAVAEEPADVTDPVEPGPKEGLPLLVVPDSRGRFRHWSWIGKQPYWSRFIALVSHNTPDDYLSYLHEMEIDTIVAGEDHVDLRSALETLYVRYGVQTIRVDSGGTLNGVLLRAGLINEVSILFHPALVGGLSPRSFFKAEDLNSPEESIPLELKRVKKLRGDVVQLVYEVVG